MHPAAVLVTGASTGIGRACALDLDRRGFRVFAGVRRELDADALRAAASDRLAPVFLDVTASDSIARAVAQVATAVGGTGLQGLVNNAGASFTGPLEFLDLESFRRHLEVNLVGQVAVTQAFLPAIREGRGRIVFMGSMGGYLALPFVGPYAASKHALEAVADALRRELIPWRIPVALVEPGAIRSEIWAKGSQEARQQIDALPERGRRLYGEILEHVLKTSTDFAAGAIEPGEVARVVHHALAARRPRTRYRVGRDARAARLVAWLLPDRWIDAGVARLFRLRA